MTEEAVDFLVHEVDKDFTTPLRQYLLDQFKRRSFPAERVNKCEGWDQPTISHELGVALVERLFECRSAVNQYVEIGWQRP
jgi:hypothetical protein